MKFASFRFDGIDRLGVEIGAHEIADVGELLREGGGIASVPEDMQALIRGGDTVLEAIAAAVGSAGARVRHFNTEAVQWYAPVRMPSKIVCLALNNRALDAVKIRAPTDHPAFFLKPFTALTGHRTPVRLRASYGLTHPEPELGVVIGRMLKDASASDTLSAVFGYTIVNDITSVGMREEDSFSVRYFKPGNRPGEVTVGEAHTTYPGRYKASDTFAPMGPWIVTRDEIPDPAALRIRCRLGDRLVASDHTRNYVWGVADALAHISRTMTLLPGDIVSMGTAVGGDADDPNMPNVPGVTRADLNGFTGLVSVTIERIGTLHNSIQMLPEQAKNS
jgi:2-keto-4-pentenoate hydratase/2-oxohepta-3-ene-1,7-dioic acid hydratase in catechol pathway